MAKAKKSLIGYKYTGTGNSFIFLDARDRDFKTQSNTHFGKMSRSEVARLLCSSSFGIGADGLVFVEVPEPKDFKKLSPVEAATNIHFKWDFYNSDGSSSEMCGNGARCMGAFGRDLGIKKGPVRFLTRAGLVEAQSVDDEIFLVQMPEIAAFAEGSKAGRTLIYDFVDSGVPHAVVRAPKKLRFAPAGASSDFKTLAAMAEKIRNEKRFATQGTNVTFIWPGENDLHLYALTFERGVEGYTQACGTGAVAAAYATHYLNLDHQIKITMPGGPLEVGLSGPRPTLSGRVDFIAELHF